MRSCSPSTTGRCIRARGSGLDLSLKVRLATIDDYSELCKLEASGDNVLATSMAVLRDSITAHLQGVYVATTVDDQLVGAAYTSMTRVASQEPESALALRHTGSGSVLHLLGILQHRTDHKVRNVAQSLR